MIVTTAQLFKVAYGKFAIGAYNINNAEQAMGLFKGCLANQAPFIVQIHTSPRVACHHTRSALPFPSTSATPWIW
mgnify:CR=1 FL=1